MTLFCKRVNPKTKMRKNITAIIAAAALFVPVWTAIAASAAGMIVEALHLKIQNQKVDDNLTVPMVAAAVIWASRLIVK